MAERGAVVGEREEGSADVVQEAGQGEGLGPDGTAGAVPGFEHEDLPALPGQGGAGDEAIRAGPDDEGVHHGHVVLSTLWLALGCSRIRQNSGNCTAEFW